MLKNRLSILAVSAAALMATMAIAAPASAATCPVSSTTQSYRLVRSYTGGFWWFRLVPVQTQTTTGTTAPKTTTAQVAQAPTVTPTAAPAPVAKTTTAAPAPATATTNGVTLTAAEQQMLNLVNAERAKAGLQPLKADAQLTKSARLKSQDMIQHNYFSHQSPTYGSPFDMMKQFGITYKTAGENIAGNSSVTAAHQALMNSAGHRANILNPNYNYVGIGIVNGGQYGMMFTQQFVGR